MVECKEWPDAKNSAGYGIMAGGKLVHRLAYKLAHPEAMLNRWVDVHHLCGNRACYEVTHLEAKAHTSHRKEHQELRRAKSTHCPQGHEFTPANTGYQNSDGYQSRYCRECSRAKAARYRERRKNRSIT